MTPAVGDAALLEQLLSALDNRRATLHIGGDGGRGAVVLCPPSQILRELVELLDRIVTTPAARQQVARRMDRHDAAR